MTNEELLQLVQDEFPREHGITGFEKYGDENLIILDSGMMVEPFFDIKGSTGGGYYLVFKGTLLLDNEGNAMGLTKYQQELLDTIMDIICFLKEEYGRKTEYNSK